LFALNSTSKSLYRGIHITRKSLNIFKPHYTDTCKRLWWPWFLLPRTSKTNNPKLSCTQHQKKSRVRKTYLIPSFFFFFFFVIIIISLLFHVQNLDNRTHRTVGRYSYDAYKMISYLPISYYYIIIIYSYRFQYGHEQKNRSIFHGTVNSVQTIGLLDKKHTIVLRSAE